MDEKPNTAEHQKPRGRWHQFRLRTLLIVVTVLGAVCGYVAREAKTVHDRKKLIAEVARLGGQPSDVFDASDPPWIRRMLGDVSQPVFIVPKNIDHDIVRRIWLAFPESEVVEFVRTEDGMVDLVPLAEAPDHS